jgi:5-methylcytosine-specific restriction endonuclease McrA
MIYKEEYEQFKTKKGNYRIKGSTYKFGKCKECNNPMLYKRDSIFCSYKCARIGSNNPNYGKPLSEEQKRNISMANKGRIRSKEFKEKVSRDKKGVPLSTEHKKNIGIANTGRVSPMKGKNHSEKTKELMREKQPKGKDSPHWKGEQALTRLAGILYKNAAPQLILVEECRENEEGFLECKCTYCGIWFIPSRGQIKERIDGINNNDTARLYCSDGCKKECPTFRKRAESLIKRDKIAAGRILLDELNREVQPELRKIVFARDNYTCQKCGQVGGSLHCHHIDPVISNPIESADMDMCIAFCKKCHVWVHKNIKGCGYGELRGCV